MKQLPELTHELYLQDLLHHCGIHTASSPKAKTVHSKEVQPPLKEVSGDHVAPTMILEMHGGIPQQTEVFVGRPGQSSLEGTGKLSEPGARALWSRRVHLHLFLSPSLGPFNAGDAWAW